MRKKTKKEHKQHGGKREGAGRPLAIRGKLERGKFTYEQAHMYETIVIKSYKSGHGQRHRKRMTRGELAMAILHMKAKTNDNYYYFLLGISEDLKKSKSDEKTGDILFRVNKYLVKKDKLYRDVLSTIIPHLEPVKKIAPLGESLKRLEELVNAQKQTPEPPPKKEPKSEYDRWGRRIIPEKEWKPKNAAALDRYLSSKEEKPKLPDYQYRRGL